jgi:DnaJ-class molecular chaperone
MPEHSIKCAFCQGTGNNPHFKGTCPTCRGKGSHRVTGKYMICDDCRGSGQKSGTTLTCYACAGVGVVPDAREELREARREIRKAQQQIEEEREQLRGRKAAKRSFSV